MTPNTPMTELPVDAERETLDEWLTANCGTGIPHGEATDLPSMLHGLSYVLRQIEATNTYRPFIGQCTSATSALRMALDHFAREALSQSLRAPAGEAVAWLWPDAGQRLNVSLNSPTWTPEYVAFMEASPLYASPPSECVKVKPLEWRQSLPTVQHAFTGFGTFYGVEPAGGGWVLTKHEGSSKTKSFWNDEAEAKAAAFDHYTAAILSALEPTT